MIPQSRPDLRPSDFAYIREILRTRQVAAGALVARLEHQFCRCVRTRYAAAASSGTAALHLGLLALGIEPGDEVLVPSYTCASVLQAVFHAGAVARLLDVDATTLNITADIVGRRLSRRTRALIVTHSFGFPAPLDELLELGVPLVEDCSLALGATYRGRPVGAFGVLSTFSLYATKVACAGEGGMVCTNDRAVIHRIRDLNGPDGRMTWRPRFNYKLSDLAAGLALSQMRRLPSLLARRRGLAVRYTAAFRDCADRIQEAVPSAQPNYYRFLLRTPKAGSVIHRTRRAGIACDRPVVRPLHRYDNRISVRDFPGTEEAFRSTVSIPLYPALTAREVATITRSVRRILAG